MPGKACFDLSRAASPRLIWIRLILFGTAPWAWRLFVLRRQDILAGLALSVRQCPAIPGIQSGAENCLKEAVVAQD